MGRYFSLFLLTILVTVALFSTLPLLVGGIFGEVEIIVGTILVLLGSFIITQLFYIIDLLKNKSR
jgi:hypothetical protein